MIFFIALIIFTIINCKLSNIPYFPQFISFSAASDGLTPAKFIIFTIISSKITAAPKIPNAQIMYLKISFIFLFLSVYIIKIAVIQIDTNIVCTHASYIDIATVNITPDNI